MSNNVTVVAGLLFGDEGKGGWVDKIVSENGAKLVVRYNGGPQAGHNVIVNDTHHTFSQFGSGMFNDGVRTYLSRYMLIDPYALDAEAAKLEAKIGEDPKRRLMIEESCAVITPIHSSMNRLRELARGKDRHGSCGRGIGEVRADQTEGLEDVLYAGDFKNKQTLAWKLKSIAERKKEEVERLAEAFMATKNPPSVVNAFDTAWSQLTKDLSESAISVYVDFYLGFGRSVAIVPNSRLRDLMDKEKAVVFEGAQGTLLDQDYGFAPYNTWTDCTYTNVHRLLEGMSCNITKLGVLRTFMTRHGVGPFPTEDGGWAMDSDHNKTNDWQGKLRCGRMDYVLLKYAIDVMDKVDGLLFTYGDVLSSGMPVCTSYTVRETGEEITHIEEPDTEKLMKCKPENIGTMSKDELSKQLRIPIRGVSEAQRRGGKKLIPKAVGAGQ